jgi:hypothetical protein
MMNEIDKDFYCSAGFKLNDKGCRIYSKLDCDKDHCRQRHRKHPTPEQFMEEYGEEYPDEGAVYYTFSECLGRNNIWRLDRYYQAKNIQKGSKGIVIIVCACTPFGIPDKDWRPE